MRQRGLTAFWPAYFDKSLSVKLGRRISLENAIKKPAAEDILTAAKNMKYYAEIDHQSKYPRTPYEKAGLVLIDTMGQKKSFVLKRLAPEIEKARTTRLNRKSTKKRDKKGKIDRALLKKKIAQHRKK